MHCLVSEFFIWQLFYESVASPQYPILTKPIRILFVDTVLKIQVWTVGGIMKIDFVWTGPERFETVQQRKISSAASPRLYHILGLFYTDMSTARFLVKTYPEKKRVCGRILQTIAWLQKRSSIVGRFRSFLVPFERNLFLSYPSMYVIRISSRFFFAFNRMHSATSSECIFTHHAKID